MNSVKCYKELGTRINVPKDLMDFLRRPENLQRIILLPGSGTSVDQDDESPLRVVDNNTVETTRWIGSLSYNGQVYTVVPRIQLSILRRIFHAAYNIAQFRTSISVGITDLFSEILPLVWFGSYSQSVRRHGFPREYVRRSDPHGILLRGRFDVVTHLRENMVEQHRIASDYDDLTYDNVINRYSLQVILHLKHRQMWPFSQGYSREAARLMHDRDWLLAHDVREDVPRKALSLKQFIRSRKNYFYSSTLQLAEAILRESQSSYMGSSMNIPQAFFLDSAEIWEMFLLGRLKEVVSNRHARNLRIESPRIDTGEMDWLMDYRGRFYRGLIPDYLLKDKEGKKILAVVDAKYRLFTQGYPPEDTITQMALYQSRYTRPESPVHGMLLYPSCEGLNPAFKEDFGILRIGEHQPRLSWWPVILSDNNEMPMREFLKGVDDSIGKAIQWVLTATNYT